MYSKLPFLIFSKSSAQLLARKGQLPCSITQNRMPKDHMSVQTGQWSIFDTISGAMQVGVPQKVSMVAFFLQRKLKPKSISLTCLCLLIRMFSALMSRCTISLSCRYCKASATTNSNCLASDSANRCSGLERRQLQSELAPPYQRTRQSSVWVSMTEVNLAIVGWLSSASILISLSRFRTLLASSTLFFSYIFMAIFSLVRLSMPILTRPYAPLPSQPQMSQCTSSSSCKMGTFRFSIFCLGFFFSLFQIFFILSLLMQLGANWFFIRFCINSTFISFARYSSRYRESSCLRVGEIPFTTFVSTFPEAELRFLLSCNFCRIVFVRSQSRQVLMGRSPLHYLVLVPSMAMFLRGCQSFCLPAI